MMSNLTPCLSNCSSALSASILYMSAFSSSLALFMLYWVSSYDLLSLSTKYTYWRLLRALRCPLLRSLKKRSRNTEPLMPVPIMLYIFSLILSRVGLIRDRMPSGVFSFFLLLFLRLSSLYSPVKTANSALLSLFPFQIFP